MGIGEDMGWLVEAQGDDFTILRRYDRDLGTFDLVGVEWGLFGPAAAAYSNPKMSVRLRWNEVTGESTFSWSGHHNAGPHAIERMAQMLHYALHWHQMGLAALREEWMRGHN